MNAPMRRERQVYRAALLDLGEADRGFIAEEYVDCQACRGRFARHDAACIAHVDGREVAHQCGGCCVREAARYEAC